MAELICPKCGTAFKVNESDYAAIVAQVRSALFNEELENRVSEVKQQLNEQFKAREESLKLKAENRQEALLNQKEHDIAVLRQELVRLNSIVENNETLKKSELERLEAKKHEEFQKSLAEKDKEIAELKSNITGLENTHKLKILEERNQGNVELQKKEQEIIKLRADINSARLMAENRENQLREQHQLQLRDKEDEINRLKDFKLRLSTKMVGETLEQHCSILFAQAQSMGQFPDAYFDKDNNVVEHSKGDFIFRDYVDGEEYVSIMFEMKNEMETTATKHRNDDFLDKLDKDRTRKGCEYAVLVSMLEQGNELYDAGIVDKSYRYPKMLVIRPQFFIPVLRLISEAAKKGYHDRYALQQELNAARSQSLDFSRFEDKLNRFRTSFSNNVTAAHKKFLAATEGIDKTIEALEKQIKALRSIKANFELSEQKLLKANELAEEDLTIKKLTYGNPTIRKMIEEAGE
ncbi:MAG: DUF2130 domain-containing protein [Muribaculaceae bacterium]|nr:DUF2130 domain-containing protein [Muribaculaceae bacterium]